MAKFTSPEDCLVPGFKGNLGPVGVLTFKAKAAGGAFVKFDHARMLLNDGNGTDVLSEVHDKVFNVVTDTTAPNPIKISLVGESDTTHVSETPTIQFSATDDLSGIDHYDVYANDKLVAANASSPYSFDKQPAGSMLVKVVAYDKSGNKTAGGLPLTIVPLQIRVPTPVPGPQPATVTYIQKAVVFPIYLLVVLNLIALLIIGGLIMQLRKNKQKEVSEERMLTELRSILHTEFTSFSQRMMLSISAEIKAIRKAVEQNEISLKEATKKIETLKKLQDQFGGSTYSNWRGRINPDNF
jgi:hypothetical protein